MGGGLGGLTSAALLARSGQRVTLAAPSLGGRARSSRHEGFTFNHGPRALLRNGIAARTFRTLGLSLQGGKPPPLQMQIDGACFPLPTSAWGLARDRGLDRHARLELAGVFARLPRASRVAGQSAAAWIARCKTPGARAYLELLSRLLNYAASSALVSAAVFVKQLRGSAGGVLYLDGGWQSLVDALRATLTRTGVAYREASVRHLERVEAGWLVDPGDASLSARALVLAVSPKVARRLVPAEQAPALHTRPLRPIRARTLDLALAQLPRPEAAFVLPTDAPFYFSLHSGSARLAPEGQHLVHALQYLDHDGLPGGNFDALESFLDQLQPGWREHVVHRRRSLASIVAHDHPAPAGRTPCRLAQDLFVVGDWVESGQALLEGVVASAREAATTLARG